MFLPRSNIPSLSLSLTGVLPLSPCHACTYSQSNPHRYRTCAPLQLTDRLPDFYPRSIHSTYISSSFSRSSCLAANAQNPRSTSLSPAVPRILRVYPLPRHSRSRGPTIGVGSPYSSRGGKKCSITRWARARPGPPSLGPRCMPGYTERLFQVIAGRFFTAWFSVYYGGRDDVNMHVLCDDSR